MIKYFFLLYLLFFLLAGCNSTKIFYNYGDILISWQIDNYFDLTNEQEEWVEEKLMSHLDWHRKKELPGYKKFLIEIKENARDGVSMNELNKSFARYETKRDRIIEKLTPDIAFFLANLKNDQIDYLESQILKGNKEIEEEFENFQERIDRKKENFFEQMENWFGKLNENQVEKLNEWQNQWYKKTSYFSKNRMQLRLKSQIQFLNLLRSNPEKTKIEKWLREWTFKMMKSSNQKRDERILTNKKRILKVDKILTDEQRNNALRELDYWIKILEETIENYES